MSQTWKTIRVFISSTFKDMQAERDHLVRYVFPKLREELLTYRIHLIDVDLRWGVTSDQDATGVCREMIDECHPRFLCILGGRYGWVPDGKEMSITADEIHYSVLDREVEKRGHAFFYFRDDETTARMVEETNGEYREPDGSENSARLEALKQKIKNAGLPVVEYHADWNKDQKRLVALGKFGEQVALNLFESLKGDPELASRFTSDATTQPDEFAEEADQMESFIEERTDRFVVGSRESLMRDMLTFAAADGEPNIFVLTGDPGSGKSALLAKFTRDVASLYPSSFILPHFVGASTGSTDLRRTLRRLCHQLAEPAKNTEPLPLDIKELITHFQKLLADAGAKKRVILVFDALNQFDATDGAHWLNWLPRELPPGVRIVASVIAPADGQPEHQTLAILRHRPGTRIEKLESLSEVDTLAIIEGSLRRYAKRLSPEQLAALLAKPASRLPLYILTALEELRTLGTYDEITARIRDLPGEARSLFRWIFTHRLACDPGIGNTSGQPCGAVLVEKLAACLAVSRHGLSTAELTALLDPGDPHGHVAALLRLLRPYLMRRGELLDFFHQQTREAAAEAYVHEADNEAGVATARKAHQALAECLRSFADPERNGSFFGGRARAMEEMPYHLHHAGEPCALHSLLGDVAYLDAALRAGLAYAYLRDAGAALAAWPCAGAEAVRRAVAGSMRTQIVYPGFGLSAMTNRLAWETGDSSGVPDIVAIARERLDAAGPWLETASMLPGKGDAAFGASRSLQCSCGTDGVIVTGESDGAVEVRSVLSGAVLAQRTIACRNALGLAAEPTHQTVAWAEKSGAIHTETSQHVLAGRAREEALAYPHPDCVIAVRRDGALVAWNPLTGDVSVLLPSVPAPLLTLRAEAQSGALFFLAGEHAGSQTMGVLVRQDKSWTVHQLPWAGANIVLGCLLPGGTQALLACADRTLAIIQTDSGAVVASVAYERCPDAHATGLPEACAAGYHCGAPSVVLATRDGHLFLWRWPDGTAANFEQYKTRFDGLSATLLDYLPTERAFYLTTHEKAAVLQPPGETASARHLCPVASAAITAGGRVASGGRDDHALRWWTFDRMEPLGKFPVELPWRMAAAGEAESVYIGTGDGCLWLHPYDRRPESAHVFMVFDHPVVGVAAVSSSVALAASSQGMIVDVDFVADHTEWLCSEIGDRRQGAVIACPDPAQAHYLSVREIAVGDSSHTLALGRGKAEGEKELLRRPGPFKVAAVSHPPRVATVGRDLAVWSLEAGELRPLFQGGLVRGVIALDFVRDGQFLVLAREDEPWLELRRCAEGLPLVAVLALEVTPTCLAIRDDRLVVGFSSGALLAIHLRGPTQPLSPQ